jgi:nitroreductase
MKTEIAKDALTAILQRKSVRNYTGEVVQRADLIQLLKAAMAAPSAVHRLPWKFIVVTNREKLKSLSDGLPFAQMLENAGTGIVVCAVPNEAAGQKESFAILDCACATENILVAAEALGLGAVWTAVYPDKALMDFVRNQLHIPDHVIPLNVIPVGYPVGDEDPREKYDAGNIHWEMW